MFYRTLEIRIKYKSGIRTFLLYCRTLEKWKNTNKKHWCNLTKIIGVEKSMTNNTTKYELSHICLLQILSLKTLKTTTWNVIWPATTNCSLLFVYSGLVERVLSVRGSLENWHINVNVNVVEERKGEGKEEEAAGSKPELYMKNNKQTTKKKEKRKTTTMGDERKWGMRRRRRATRRRAMSDGQKWTTGTHTPV